MFRLSVLYMAVLSASAAIVLAFIHHGTVGLIDRETNETIEADFRGLAEQYAKFGLEGLLHVIEERSGEKADPRALYLVVDGFLQPLAGNLAVWPDVGAAEDGWFQFALQIAEHVKHEARARIFPLERNHQLLVGRDIEDRLDLQRLITSNLFWSLAVVGILSTLIGVIISRNMLRRVDAIARAAQGIIQGDLSKRMPIQGIGDEFDRVAANVNRMLTKIESLTSGMRTVIDSVAHDLRGPITRMRSHIELTLAGPPDTEAFRHALYTTLTESDRLQRTVDSLLHIAQAEAGALGMEMDVIDLAALVRGVLDLYQPLAEEKQIAVESEIGTGARIRGNRQLLAHGVANLIDNAIKYTPAGGRLGLDVAVEGTHARIAVWDTGPGIPAVDRTRVLQRFVRLDASRTTPGSGLGLSLVAAVAQMHHAPLELGDNAPGLRVTLTFDVAPEDTSSGPGSASGTR